MLQQAQNNSVSTRSLSAGVLEKTFESPNFFLLKNSFWHRCFPVNFAKFVRTPFLQNTSGRLLRVSNKVMCYHCLWRLIYHKFVHTYKKVPSLSTCFVLSAKFCNLLLWSINDVIILKFLKSKQIWGEILNKYSLFGGDSLMR